MSAKRKLVYNGHHGVEGEAANCLWCGQVTSEYSYVINPGGTPVLKCCCEEHYRKTESFIERDARFLRFSMCFLRFLPLLPGLPLAFLSGSRSGRRFP